MRPNNGTVFFEVCRAYPLDCGNGLTATLSRRRRITFRAQTHRSACTWSRPRFVQVSEISFLDDFRSIYTILVSSFTTRSRTSPGVYWLRDPRSRIYNFTPWLESIPPVTDFAFERVTGFVRSSMDNVCDIH